MKQIEKAILAIDYPENDVDEMERRMEAKEVGAL